MARVFIGVGSNEGDRLSLVSRALQLLGRSPGIRLVQMATIQETEPFGGPPQGPYANTVVEVETALSPSELLRVTQAIERQLGRRPAMVRWAPRPIDLDLLLYDALVLREAGLELPHPRLHERRFVLEPLAQLAPDLLHPVLKQSMSQLLDHCAIESMNQ